ncbi:MAG: hypothetical protein KJZ74_11845 [Gemmatimonadales bacterium]|nr:hypothetical protein [Gemmatimonadales bacterium]
MTRRWSPPRAVRRGALAVSLGLLVTVLTTIPGACAAGDRGAATPAAAGVVDSALPIAVLLERFRRATPETLTTLTGGADTPERLARTLLTAVAAHDTAGVRALVLSRAEFAWLYYPHTRFVAPPYELGPELAWLTHAAESGKGERRLLARFGGHALGVVALDCPGSITDEGPNRVIGGCEMRFTDGAESPRRLRLFGALLYRDGRYKFLSYVNDL